jgi:cytochrome b6-f complex iron-sulfur subunit
MTMPCDDCMNRRRFLSTAAGAAGLVALSGCGDGEVTGPFAELPGPLSITVGQHAGLATIGNLVKIPLQPVAVKRTGPADFEAFSMSCTHQGCLTRISSNAFVCDCHGSRFTNDGAVAQGPAESPLGRFITSYDAATDTLTIT